MSHTGHQRPFGDVRCESAYPRILDMTVQGPDGRNGPLGGTLLLDRRYILAMLAIENVDVRQSV